MDDAHNEWDFISVNLICFVDRLTGREETGLWHHIGAGHGQYGSHWAYPNANQADPARTSGQNLRHALGIRL